MGRPETWVRRVEKKRVGKTPDGKRKRLEKSSAFRPRNSGKTKKHQKKRTGRADAFGRLRREERCGLAKISRESGRYKGGGGDNEAKTPEGEER